MDDPVARWRRAVIVAPCVAPTAGYVAAINTEEVALWWLTWAADAPPRRAIPLTRPWASSSPLGHWGGGRAAAGPGSCADDGGANRWAQERLVAAITSRPSQSPHLLLFTRSSWSMLARDWCGLRMHHDPRPPRVGVVLGSWPMMRWARSGFSGSSGVSTCNEHGLVGCCLAIRN